MSMSNPINILVIEDNNADFLLVERHLSKHGLSACCSRVDSLEGLQKAIESETWDLVLSDFFVPQLRFQDSLSLLLAAFPDLPVIMVTGAIGEEKAVELLKLGARDFVLKGNLARLVPAIERSLRETAEKKAKQAAETALAVSENMTRNILDNIGMGVALISPRMEVLEMNRVMSTWFPAVDTRQTCTCYRVFNDPPRDTPCNHCPIQKTLQDGRVHEETRQAQHAAGVRNYRIISSPIFNVSGEVIAATRMVEDVTEKLSLETQLRQSQKIEAVGLLAGGVAHDFNNILTAIIGYSHLILEQSVGNEPVKRNVEEILIASRRAAALTQGLLAFSRKQPVTLAVIDLSEVICGNEAFLRRLISEDIELTISCCREPLAILADRGQMEQVIMNLVTNASDAMPNGGRLSIETQSVTLDQEFIDTHGYGSAGSYALLSVFDSGVGMDKETQSRIFEPFYTTKEQGKGTGIGLSMAYGIVKKHDGFINVYSEPGTGTIFKICLPRLEAAGQVVKTESREAEPLRGGTETILVGEDDAALLRLTTNVLGHYGYCVIGAVDGQDAVDKFVEYGDSISLVVLDAIMPKKNGKQAYDAMRVVRPDLKAVFVSGYSRDIFAEGTVLDGHSAFIQKPVSPDELLTKVREMLDRQIPAGVNVSPGGGVV